MASGYGKATTAALKALGTQTDGLQAEQADGMQTGGSNKYRNYLDMGSVFREISQADKGVALSPQMIMEEFMRRQKNGTEPVAQLTDPENTAARIARYEDNERQLAEMDSRIRSYGQAVMNPGKGIRDELKALEERRDALAQEQNQYERLYKSSDYGAEARKQADFSKQAAVRPHEEDAEYIAVNFDRYTPSAERMDALRNSEEYRRIIQMNSMNTDSDLTDRDMLYMSDPTLIQALSMYKKRGVQKMTDEERDTYNYLYETRGREAAHAYLQDLIVDVDKRESEKEMAELADSYEQSSVPAKIAMNAITIPASVFGGAASAVSDVLSAVSTEESVMGGKYNPYSSSHAMTEFAQTIRGKTAQEIAAGINNDTVSDFASNTYQAIMSAADSVLGAFTMGKAYTFAMGAGAASSRAKELYEQGAGNVQIARGAIASGVAEALFEYVSLDHLIKTGASSTVKEFVANIIKQSGIEASEEVSTEIANKIIDAANRGYQSDHSQAVQAYMEAGETEENARKLAWRDDAVDILWAGYGGAVSGGFSAGAYGGVNLMHETNRRIDMCKSVGQEFLQEDQNGGNRLEEAMSIGLTNAKGTEGYAMAQEIAAKLERGKTPTAYQLGRMLLESTSVQAMRARTIEGTILDSARKLGVDEKTAESVSALMVRADRAAVFVAPETLQTVGKDGDVNQFHGQYMADGTVAISAGITTEEALEFVVKHELTHAIEGSEAYGKLQQLVRKSMGEEAYTAAVEQAQQERSDRGDTQGARNPEAEVVADWIAGNLYKDGFARIIRNMDGGAAVRFRAVLDNIQRALGLTKNFRQAAAIRSAERAFAEVLQSDYSRNENETAAETGDGQFAYGTGEKGDVKQESGEYHIKEQIRKHLDELNSMNPVSSQNVEFTFEGFQKSVIWAMNYFSDEQDTVRRNGIGDIVIDKKRISKAITYMKSETDIMCFAALRDVIEKGTVIDGHHKHKGREYDTVTIAAPVEINGVRYNMAAVIRQDGLNYYKVHRILMPDGSVVDIKSARDTSKRAGGGENAPGLSPNDDISSKAIIPQQQAKSQENFSNGQKSYLPEDLQAREEAAAAEKAENARRLAEEEGGDTEWEYDDEEMAGLLYEAMEKRRTKLQEAQREETERLTARLQNGEITAEDFNAAMERLRTEAVEDNDRKWRTGNRGTAQQKEQIRQVRREARQEYGDKRDAAERSRMSAADRERIGKMLDSLESMLEHPDKHRHVPVEATAAVRDLLLAVREDPVDIQRQIKELVGKLQETSDSRQILRLQKKIDERRARLEKTYHLTEDMAKVEKTYREVAGTGLDGKAKESPFQRHIEEVMEILEDKKLSDLNAGELHVVVELMKSIHGQLLSMNRLHSKAFKEGAHETGMRMAQEMTDAKGYTNETMRNLMLWQLTPGRFFEAICGWKQDSVGAKIAAELNEAQRKTLEIRRAYHQLFHELTNGENAANYARLTSTKEEDLVDIGLVDNDGKPMKMTRGLMMSLYESLCCQGNRRALMDAGMILPQLNRYYSGKEADAYVQGQKLSLSALSEDIFRVLEKAKEHKPRSKEYADLQLQYLALVERANQDLDQLQERIEEEMTDYEMELHQAIRQWFDVDSKRMLNEVTTQLWNYEAARVKDYFPIYRSKDFVATAMESIISDRTLASSGNLKARVSKSKVPVHIADITSVLQTSMEKTAQFCGFAAFQEDFTRIYNATSSDMNTSFKKALGLKWGKGKAHVGVTGDQYIQNLMADISGGREGGSSFLSFFRRNAVRATLTMNLRVAVSQAASLPTAAAEIGWQYTAKALQNLPKVNQKTMDRIAQYSAYFFERYRGAGGMEEFSAAKEGSNALDKGYRWLDKATKGKLLNWCQEVDVRTVAIQWFGCEEAIKDTRPELKPGSDEYYKAVGEMLDRVIIKTQPNFTTAQRSDLLRSKNEALKFLTMYKTQANQNMNILYEVTGRLRAAKKSGDEAQIEAAKKGMVNGYTAVLVGTMVFALMRALVNLLQHRENGYRDKDGEVSGAKIAGAIGQEMLSGVAGMFTFGDIIYEVVSARVFGDYYFGVSDAALGNISSLLDDVATGNLKSGNVWYKVWKDTMNLLGIPWKNGADIVTGFWDHLTDIAHGEFLSFNAHSGVETSAYYRQLLHAQRNGKTDKAAKLREFLLDSGKTENQIAAGLRSAMQEEADFEKREKRLLREAMESMLYKSMTEQEQKKVRSGISGYLADTMLEEQTGSTMTAAHKKAQRVIDKGLSPAAYYVGEAAKNGTTADRDGDGTVTRQEYRAMLSKSDYDQITQAVLLAQKRNTTKKKEE